MPVQWVKPSARPIGPGFVPVKSNRAVFILCTHAELACLKLHWSLTANGSVPCMGLPDCKLCPDPPREHAYAPCLWLPRGSRKDWRPGLLDLGNPGGQCALEYKPRVPIIVGREKEGNSRSPMVYRGVITSDTVDTPTNAAPFDVRPHLLRRWGLFDEADRIRVEPYYEQETLPFDPAKAG